MLTKQIKKQKDIILESATVRDFSGGWNLLDDDLNLSSKYARRLYNCAVLADSTVTVRYGTRLFANLAGSTSDGTTRIINQIYFGAAIVNVMANGEIIAVQANGFKLRIWDSTLAAALPGAPAGWSSTDFASFAIFNGELIICNGVDKPLIVYADLTVDYLQDLGTNSNLNTPVGKYCTVCERYLIIAGDPVNPNRIHISAKDASGTFYGDPDPNDATFLDLGSILNNSTYIRGITSFRGKLVIGFVEGTIIYTLGQYDAVGAHIPAPEDPVEQYGAVSHRGMISYGDDMLMMDLVGVPSLKKTVFTGTLKPERISDLVDTEIAEKMDALSFKSIEDRCFAIYNQREGQFMFFIPNSDGVGSTTETSCYVYLYRPNLSLSTWARYDGWNFTSACRSTGNELFFGDKDGKIWHYGSQFDEIYADFIDDPSQDDRPIQFDWELPWSDLKQRTKSKTSKYIKMDTEGDAQFTAMMFVDRYRLNADGVDDPALAMEFTAGDTGAYGDGDQPFGGGRNTANERGYAWPCKFNLMKLRFNGSTIGKLKFISVTLMYQRGNYFR